MQLQKELSQTGSGLITSNTARLPTNTVHQIPEKLVQLWEAIPPAKFQPEKALQCFAITRGAWQSINPSGVESALKSDAPTLGAVSFYTTKAHAVQLLKEMIAQTSLLLNVGKNLHEAQIGPVSELIFEQYKYLTVADFRAALKMGVLGQFGATYDRFDVQVISEWLTKYWELRTGAAEMRSTVKSVTIEKEVATPPPPAVQKWINDLHKRVEQKAAKPPPEIDELMVNQWRTDWEQGDKLTTFENYKNFKIQQLKRTK